MHSMKDKTARQSGQRLPMLSRKTNPRGFVAEVTILRIRVPLL